MAESLSFAGVLHSSTALLLSCKSILHADSYEPAQSKVLHSAPCGPSPIPGVTVWLSFHLLSQQSTWFAAMHHSWYHHH